ncbi:SigE family RNA polymerase sigma factor [Asanoa iriomotensis]|uniref:RNA polymerase sigma24 factor n=1 Tax=Asanoa iriomotensis TaxID=234613 RepID=A0ABQ4BZH9_9ACTN|nr:SigE family RNA polymerase sigma factor [Asanoa iriomotensis]GIF55948.1 RNA polymerase sigma24 factor [Asanoa iriomotensis]
MAFAWRGGRHDVDEEFVAYYAARARSLRNTAYLLCGDWHLAEDLTQITFTNLYRAWHRIQRHDVLDQYARRVLLRAFLDERRRPWRRELATTPGSSTLDSVATDEPGAPDERKLLDTALARLSPRHRAVLVLRFWDDLSVEQVADILRCSTGTVKSQTSRGLVALRALLGAELTSGGQP